VAWNPDRSIPLLLLAPNRVRQVLLNLVLNAVEAMPEGGTLTVTTVRTDEPSGARIVVADDGVGIPPDVLPHIFEAFSTTKPEGLGLGLYISRRIVEEHGGWIHVDSQLGRGSAVTLQLPAS
jgi:signal transduction histidine kinase